MADGDLNAYANRKDKVGKEAFVLGLVAGADAPVDGVGEVEEMGVGG